MATCLATRNFCENEGDMREEWKKRCKLQLELENQRREFWEKSEEHAGIVVIDKELKALTKPSLVIMPREMQDETIEIGSFDHPDCYFHEGGVYGIISPVMVFQIAHKMKTRIPLRGVLLCDNMGIEKIYDPCAGSGYQIAMFHLYSGIDVVGTDPFTDKKNGLYWEVESGVDPAPDTDSEYWDDVFSNTAILISCTDMNKKNSLNIVKKAEEHNAGAIILGTTSCGRYTNKETESYLETSPLWREIPLDNCSTHFDGIMGGNMYWRLFY